MKLKNPILGTADLRHTADGVMEGKANLYVRGTFRATLTRESIMDNGMWRARLRVGRDEAEVHQIPVIAAGTFEDMPEGDIEHWHTFIKIEGYTMQFRGEKTPEGGMRCWFLDSIQPMPWKPEWDAPGDDAYDRDIRDTFKEPAE